MFLANSVKFIYQKSNMMRLKFIFSLVKESFSEFLDDNALKLSAALSYYTIFSLAPLLLVLITVASFLLGKEAFQGELFGQISGLVGNQAAAQLQEIIKNAEVSNKTGTAAIIGVVTLIIGATGVFAEIQDSINYIWSIKSKPSRGWLQYLKNRLLSFSIIITLGFLLIVSLGVNTMVDFLSQRLEQYFSEVSVLVFSALNLALVAVVIIALFTVIFKVLPDGYLRWKECVVGATFTAFMFIIGKFVITFYLGQSDLGATYGASASIVILLTWVYYSSIILYFGAEFTKVYARSDGFGITPNEHAVLIDRHEVISDVTPQTQEQPLPLLEKVKVNTVGRIMKLIDDKIDALKAEIKVKLSEFATPVVYYCLVALFAFVVVITIILLLGSLLNRWLNSDYWGYVILLVLAVILIPVSIIYREKLTRAIRTILINTKSDS
jgi:membrane protein